jgi:tRNA A22 N-methylase
MGSFLIAQILEKAPNKTNVTYILQANDKTEYLRKYLSEHGFMIIDEYIRI